MRLSAARGAPPPRDHRRVPVFARSSSDSRNLRDALLARGLGAWTPIQVRQVTFPRRQAHSVAKIYQFNENVPVAKGRRDAVLHSARRYQLQDRPMLILTRRVGETVMIGDEITVTVLDVKGNQIRLGIAAPKEIPVHREEVYIRVNEEKARQRP